MLRTVRDAFEDKVAGMVKNAYDFTGRGDSVEALWIYITSQEGVSFCKVVYKISGTISRVQDIDQHLSEPVGAAQNQLPLLKSLSRDSLAILQSFKEAQDDVPTRIVVRYLVDQQETNAEFRYGPIPVGKDQTWSQVFNQWVADLATTGNDAA